MKACSGIFGRLAARGGRTLRVLLLVLGAMGLDPAPEAEHRRDQQRPIIVQTAVAAVPVGGTTLVRRSDRDRPVRWWSVCPPRVVRPGAGIGIGWTSREARWVVLLI